MFVWQTLVQTPVISLLRMQASSPSIVCVEHVRPAAALVADDLGAFDADERRDVAEPRAASRAISSVMNWPLVKTWK